MGFGCGEGGCGAAQAAQRRRASAFARARAAGSSRATLPAAPSTPLFPAPPPPQGRASATAAPEGCAPLSSVAVSPDGSALVAANYNGVVFAMALGAAAAAAPPAAAPSPAAAPPPPPSLPVTSRWQAHRGYVTAARLSPDGALLATASSDKSVKLWSVHDGYAPVATLAGHARWVWDAVYSADSSYLVTASSDMLCKLWEVATGDVVRTYAGHTKAVTAVALNDAT